MGYIPINEWTEYFNELNPIYQSKFYSSNSS